MNLRQYLSQKYSIEIPTTITKAEAKIFGIPYPLRSGWLKEFGHIEIISDLKARLLQSLKDKRGRGTSLAGLAVFEVVESIPIKIKVTKEKKPREKRVRVARAVKVRFPSCGPASREFLDTFEWRAIRMKALKKYGRVCMCCGASPETGAVIHVDHIKPRKLFPMLALDLDNLQILCHECNHGKGNWDQTDWRPAEEEIESDVIKLLRSISME